MSFIAKDGKTSLIDTEILVVEDALASRELLSDLIEMAGYKARQAHDGSMALELIQNKLPDLILLDVRMPGIDGFEVCRRLKASADTAAVPVIFLSGLQDSEARIQGLKLGAVDYIVKPYEPDEVLLRVRTNLELRNLQLHLEDMIELRTRQLKEEIAERKHAEEELLESRQKLRELTGHLQEVREAERTRIAREIHDELGQSLTVARIDLSRLAARLHKPKTQLEKYIANIDNVLEQASNTARSISENLRPGMLDLLGLGAAIEHHVMRFSEISGIQSSVKMNRQDELDIDNKVATAAFRILQESLTNVARHAQASKVNIQVANLGSELVLIIQDNGRGIDTSKPDGRGHYGLLGMNERAVLLGGHLVVESAAGKGTRIEANLPLDKR